MIKLFSNLSKLSKPPYRKKTIFSLISAFVLIICNYFVNNASLFTGESTYQYAFFQHLCTIIGIHDEVNYSIDDIIFFNNSYDKTLIPIYKGDYENKELIGNNVITDRSKLLRLLTILKETNSYDFVVIDLKFDAKDSTEFDTALFRTIASMRNIVFVDYENLPKQAHCLKHKTAKANYEITPLITNFARYKFLYDDAPSVPLYIYNKLNYPHNIKRYGFSPFYIYLDNVKLCQNSLFLTFDFDDNTDSKKYSADEIENSFITSFQCENIGEFIKRIDNSCTPEEDKELFKLRSQSKIIFIGNLKDDVHDTYVGPKTGGQIMFRAFTSLREGKHLVNPFITLCWLLVFFLISLNIIINRPIVLFIRKLVKNRFVLFLFSLFSYTIILSICSFLEYILFDRVYSIIVPLIYFSFLKLAIQFKSLDTK